MPNNRSLDGKVAVATGASRGIGKQVCLALARRGARLVLASTPWWARRSIGPGASIFS